MASYLFKLIHFNWLDMKLRAAWEGISTSHVWNCGFPDASGTKALHVENRWSWLSRGWPIWEIFPFHTDPIHGLTYSELYVRLMLQPIDWYGNKTFSFLKRFLVSLLTRGASAHPFSSIFGYFYVWGLTWHPKYRFPRCAAKWNLKVSASHWNCSLCWWDIILRFCKSDLSCNLLRIAAICLMSSNLLLRMFLRLTHIHLIQGLTECK